MTHWPQYTFMSLYILNAGMVAAKFGQPKTGNYGFVELVIGPLLGIFLLYMGGFWTGVLNP